MLEVVSRRLGIRPTERRMVARLFWLHFALITSYTLSRATRDAVFLATHRAQLLPYIFIALAFFTALVSVLLGRASRQQQLQRSLAQMLVLCGATLFGFGLLFHLQRGPVPPIAFYLWNGAYGLILVSLFWALVSEAADPREARRLLGVIGAGGILGGMVGGAVTSAIGAAIGPESMLYLAGAILLAVVPLVSRVLDAGSSRAIPVVSEPVDERPLLRDLYVRRVALFFLVGGVTASLLDYQFKVALQVSSGGDRMQMARFLGYYYTVLNAGGILLQLLAAGYLLRRFGASNVSGLLPTGLVIGTTLALLRPPSLLLATGLRMWDAGMRVSLAKSAWEFLFFPLPSGLRRRAKTFVDAVVDRFSEALAGLLILGFVAVVGTSPRAFSLMIFLFSGLWMWANWRLQRAYVRQLSTSLRRLVVDDAETAEGPAEAQIIQEAHHMLASTFERRALYAFELLERMDPVGLDRRLGELQDHPAAGVRARAVGRLADPAHPLASPLLRNILHDSSPAVRDAAIQLYAARYGDAQTQMEEMLESSNAAARAAALTHLVSRSDAGSEPAVAARLDSFLESGAASDRRAVAQALAKRPRSPFLHAKLLQLLGDADLDVRRDAIATAGAVRLREFVPALVPLLSQTATREAARSALAAYGNRVVGTIGDYLADPSVAIAMRRELPRVLAEIGTQEAANELLRVPFTTDSVLLTRLVKAQNKIRRRNSKVVFPRVAVREALQRDIEQWLRLHMHVETWEREDRSRARDLLLGSLQERLEVTFGRIFRRLGLLYPAEEIFLGYRALAGGQSRRTRAQALEYLDTTLLPEDRRLLVPLLEEPDRRLVLAESLYGIRSFDRVSSLVDLVRGTDAWLQACALFVIGFARWEDLADLVRGALGPEASPLVQETATWSLARLEES